MLQIFIFSSHRIMFKKILKSYLILFLLFYAGYTLLNWIITVKTGLIQIEDNYTNFWIPLALVYVLVFLVLRPIIKKSDYKPNIKDGLLWALFPFTMWIPVAFSQEYYKDASYDVITLNSPKEVGLYKNERFFEIKDFYINRNDFTLFKERHVSGGRSKSLKVNNYYIAPLYCDSEREDTDVAYGLKFSTSLNHGLLFRDEQPKKIWEFNIKSASEFTFYDLDSVTYFEKQVDSEDATNYAAAWKENDLLNKAINPVVLVAKTETFQQSLKRERNIAFYSTLICLIVGVGVLLLHEYFRK